MKVFVFMMALMLSVDSPIMLGIKTKVRRDEYLIVPGLGAESIIVNDKESDVRSKIGKEKYTISRIIGSSDIFMDIFGIKGFPSIVFNNIYFIEKIGVTYFMLNDTVVAIAGLRNNRVTIDSVELYRGVKYVLNHYNQTPTIKKEIQGNVIIIFPEIRFAIGDDDGNDSIDFYLVY